MTQQQFEKLKAGQQITLTKNADVLHGHGIQRALAGTTQTILRIHNAGATPTDRRVAIQEPLYGGETWLMATDIDSGTLEKAPKFSRKDIEALMIKGADNLLKAEMNVRIQTVRSAIQAAGAIKDHNAQMKVVAEQLRQIKLIRAAIREKVSN